MMKATARRPAAIIAATRSAIVIELLPTVLKDVAPLG
jgi:hypothetical protein